MESKLAYLFDFQKFEGNRALQDVIDEVHARRSMAELDLDDMQFVSAAGVPDRKPDRKKP